jgi:hypothetical protein
MLDRSELEQLIVSRPDLLLGNGFSIALSEEADFTNLSALAADDPIVGQVLRELGSGNVEHILSIFEKLEVVSEFKPIINYLRQLRGRITSALINSLISINPKSRNEICELSIIETNRILKRFDVKFTVNFDPFLYWAILQSIGDWMSDGFSTPHNANQLYWDKNSLVKTWWIHGSIFHFPSRDNPREIFKVKRSVDMTLVEFTKSQIQELGLPTAILGGTSTQKIDQIGNNDYLLAAVEALASRKKPLVIFGWSNSENDKHLELAIRNRDVYFGVHSPESVQGQHQVVMARNNNWKCFDSSMLPFWKHEQSDFYKCNCPSPGVDSLSFQ